MFISQLDLKTFQEVERKEDEFLEILGSGKGSEEAYQELLLFFKNADELTRLKYQHTYWRWFTFLTWDRLNAVSKEDLVNFFDKQIIMAYILEFDVPIKIMNYFVLNCYDEISARNLFARLKDKIVNSTAIINGDQPTTLNDVVEKIKIINRPSSSSIEQADAMVQIKKMVFPSNESPSYMVAPSADWVISRLRETVEYFIEMNPDEIWSVINNYIDEDYYKIDISNFDNQNNRNEEKITSDAIPGRNRSETKIAPTKPVSPAAVVKPVEIVKIAKPTVQTAAPQSPVKKEEPKPVEKKPEVKIVPPKPEIKPIEIKTEQKPEPKKPEIKQPEVKKEDKKPELKPEIKPVEKKPEVKPAKTEDPMFFLSKKAPQPPKKEIKKEVVKEENMPAPKALQQAAVPKKADIFAPVDPGKKHLSYKEIRRQVESRFPKDKTGHFLNIVDVMHELERIGHEQGDLKVRDLYYFNEQSGSFEWNENLLKD